MSNRRWVFIIMAALLLLLTSCSSGGQVMDGEDMVRSYTQISQEIEPENPDESVPASADALVGEFDFSAEKVLLNSGWEMPIIGTGTWTLSDEEAENYDIFDFELSEDEMDRIRGIDEQRRYEHW
jgi:hypothetical protein